MSYVFLPSNSIQITYHKDLLWSNNELKDISGSKIMRYFVLHGEKQGQQQKKPVSSNSFVHNIKSPNDMAITFDMLKL